MVSPGGTGVPRAKCLKIGLVNSDGRMPA